MSELAARVRPFTGRKFLVIFLAFFGTVMSVNAVFIALALKSNSGVVTEHPYEEGLAYNKTLAEAEAQKSLGWVTAMTVTSNRVTYKVTDASGHVPPIKAILVRMARPVQKGYDFQVKLERQSDNSFSTPATFPLKGAWDAHISIEYDRGIYYDKVSLLVP